MYQFQRNIQRLIESRIHEQKVSLILGARRVGKTILLKEIFQKVKDQAVWLVGEDQNSVFLLEERTVANYKRVLNGNQYLFIDEAQFIPDITLKAKLMIDNIHPLHIFLSGSSAFQISQMEQPLVGRLFNYPLYPLSHLEWKQKQNPFELRQHLEDKLIYGNYPELDRFDQLQRKQEYLRDLVSGYLMKDILVFENIRNSDKLRKLLTLLAYQQGNEVHMLELGKQLAMSKNTVEKYIDLFNKAFITYSLSAYSTNLRKEVSKGKKIYFYDNGVRNAIIGDFRPLSIRNDPGILWEQYFLSERIKFNDYQKNIVESYFWRNYNQQEIDLIERDSTHFRAFECKWKQEKTKIPVAFQKAYPDASFNLVNNDNYYKWLEEKI